MSNATENTETAEQPAAPAKRKYKRKRHTAASQKPLKVPEEFAGMTEFDCCAACVANGAQAEPAQRRLNEIDLAYPRQPSRNPRSETVMESDGEWLVRNPHIADEFRRVVAQRAGKCVISGGPTCAHPFKGGQVPRDNAGLVRFERAKKVLAHRKIDLTKG